MKNKFIAASSIAAGFISILFASCNKQDSPKYSDNLPDGYCKVTLGLDTGITKLSSSAVEDEAKVNNVQYFIFDANETLESYVTKSGTSTSAQVTLLKGPKTIYALVNSNSTPEFSTMDEFRTAEIPLSENRSDNLVMTGCTTMLADEDASTIVPVVRQVSKVVLNSITTDFVAPVYQNGNITIKSVYLQKAVKTALVNSSDQGSGYYNQSTFTEGLSGLIGENLNMSLHGNTTVPMNYIFFPAYTCFPDETRLVIKAELEGVDYYYPFILPVMERNKIYTITNLKITRPGLLDPTGVIEWESASLDISIVDWTTGEEINQTI